MVPYQITEVAFLLNRLCFNQILRLKVNGTIFWILILFYNFCRAFFNLIFEYVMGVKIHYEIL